MKKKKLRKTIITLSAIMIQVVKQNNGTGNQKAIMTEKWDGDNDGIFITG